VIYFKYGRRAGGALRSVSVWKMKKQSKSKRELVYIAHDTTPPPSNCFCLLFLFWMLLST
jgi:hypothetical protein